MVEIISSTQEKNITTKTEVCKKFHAYVYITVVHTYACGIFTSHMWYIDIALTPFKNIMSQKTWFFRRVIFKFENKIESIEYVFTYRKMQVETIHFQWKKYKANLLLRKKIYIYILQKEMTITSFWKDYTMLDSIYNGNTVWEPVKVSKQRLSPWRT